MVQLPLLSKLISGEVGGKITFRDHEIVDMIVRTTQIFIKGICKYQA